VRYFDNATILETLGTYEGEVKKGWKLATQLSLQN
jgi:hypothetical protein